MKQLLIILSVLFFFSCKAQNNTLQFPENGTAPKATLNQAAWISGHWKGEAFGDITEEIWSSPLGKSMFFSFKLVAEGEDVFYEFRGIRELDVTLLLQLKHFGKDFKGWEEKDETIAAKS